MEEKPEQKDKFPTPEEYVENVRQSRLKLREMIKNFMEEETGETYKMEDDLSAIMKTFTKEQQQNVYGRLQLALKFPNVKT